MRYFPSSNGYTHILVVVDYVTKWQKLFQLVVLIITHLLKCLKKLFFPRYLMTDGGSHFIHGAFRKMLAKYDVNHRIESPYHPQSSGQV